MVGHPIVQSMEPGPTWRWCYVDEDYAEVADRPARLDPLSDTPDVYGAYPRLSDDQIAILEVVSARRAVDTGECWSARVAFRPLLRRSRPARSPSPLTDDGRNRHVIRGHGPGRFLGGAGDLEGQAAFYTAEVWNPAKYSWYRPSGVGPGRP